MSEEPIQRFTLLVLFQAQQDHATELTIAAAAAGPSPIRYKVGGTWYDMSAPPAHIMPAVVAELGRMATFTKRPFPKEGLIDVPYSGVRLRWRIRMASAEADCILTPVEE
jgi:type II secretory ATPase GspE/PulE/Tfp pilus assembly ATPase PilB-like protein